LQICKCSKVSCSVSLVNLTTPIFSGSVRVPSDSNLQSIRESRPPFIELHLRSLKSITRKVITSSSIRFRRYHVRKAPEPVSPEVVQLLANFASHAPLPISLAKLLSFGRPLTNKSVLDSVSYVRRIRSNACRNPHSPLFMNILGTPRNTSSIGYTGSSSRGATFYCRYQSVCRDHSERV
jgi:hypothetical protein